MFATVWTDALKFHQSLLQSWGCALAHPPDVLSEQAPFAVLGQWVQRKPAAALVPAVGTARLYVSYVVPHVAGGAREAAPRELLTHPAALSPCELLGHSWGGGGLRCFSAHSHADFIAPFGRGGTLQASRGRNSP